jgi:uncharacterized protein (DUF1778 family)
MAVSQSRSEKLDLRVAFEVEHILQEAVREVLAERARIGLNGEDWTAFMAALDAAPREHTCMGRC